MSERKVTNKISNFMNATGIQQNSLPTRIVNVDNRPKLNVEIAQDGSQKPKISHKKSLALSHENAASSKTQYVHVPQVDVADLAATQQFLLGQQKLAQQFKKIQTKVSQEDLNDSSPVITFQERQRVIQDFIPADYQETFFYMFGTLNRFFPDVPEQVQFESDQDYENAVAEHSARFQAQFENWTYSLLRYPKYALSKLKYMNTIYDQVCTLMDTLNPRNIKFKNKDQKIFEEASQAADFLKLIKAVETMEQLLMHQNPVSLARLLLVNPCDVHGCEMDNLTMQLVGIQDAYGYPVDKSFESLAAIASAQKNHHILSVFEKKRQVFIMPSIHPVIQYFVADQQFELFEICVVPMVKGVVHDPSEFGFSNLPELSSRRGSLSVSAKLSASASPGLKFNVKALQQETTAVVQKPKYTPHDLLHMSTGRSGQLFNFDEGSMYRKSEVK